MSEVTLATANKDQLLAAAEKLGIVTDGRWGEDRLREEIAKEQEAQAQAKAAADKNAQRLADEEAAEAAKNASMPNLAAETAALAATTPTTNPGVSGEAGVAEPESPMAKRRRMRDEALALVRINISSMNPADQKLKNVMICVSNRNIGSIQRVIPFNRDWHVEQCILTALQEKNYMVFDEEKTPRAGITIKTPRNVPAYNIRILPPLTPQELKELAQRQAMADGTQAAL